MIIDSLIMYKFVIILHALVTGRILIDGNQMRGGGHN
jgi:hypothetical protein